MSSHALLLIFSLLPLISSWNYTAGYRECSSGCCYYSSSNTSLDYNCTSYFCGPASNSSCILYNTYSTYSRGYRECSNPVNCCYYSILLTYFDYDCQSYYCTNATNSSYCNNTYTSGYRSCVYGWCLYEASLADSDYDCISRECSSSYSTYCAQNTTNSSTNGNSTSNTTNGTYTTYNSGYRSCIYGCCYYSQTSYTEDYACYTYYCSSASSSYCSNNGGSSGGSSSFSSSDQATWEADYLTRYSGKTYIVVVYPAWKAFVAAGSIITGLWFFLDVYLIYFKCFHKPRGWTTGGSAMPNQQNTGYQPNVAYQQPPVTNFEMGGVPDSRN